MDKGIIIMVVGIVVILCSMGVWMIDNSLFEVTATVAMGGIIIVCLGLIAYIVETLLWVIDDE